MMAQGCSFRVGWGVLALVCLAASVGSAAAPVRVGIHTRIEGLVLPGTELEAMPLEDRKTALVLRIVDTFPHGTAYRYDIVYYALEPGKYNLCQFLRRKDGSSTSDLPEVCVTVEGVLPVGQIEPNPLTWSQPARIGWYRLTLWIGGGIWVAGLGLLLLARKRKQTQAIVPNAPETIADRLRPLIEKAADGTITKTEQADLERTLIGYWRKRLNLSPMLRGADVIGQLRQHSEAGKLLEQLEYWLHRPGTPENIDPEVWLAPYREMPDDLLVADIVEQGEAT